MSRFAAAELDRAVQQAVRVGVVAELDAAAGLVRVAIGALTTGWIPWLTPRAGGDRAWWAPEPGEQVIVLTPAGQGARAVALPALYSDARPAPAAAATVHRTVYADGAVLEYDRAAHRLAVALPAGGVVAIVAPAGVTLEAPAGMTIGASGGITIEGDVAIEGRLTASDDVLARTVSLWSHVHDGVASGSATTDVPVR